MVADSDLRMMCRVLVDAEPSATLALLADIAALHLS